MDGASWGMDERSIDKDFAAAIGQYNTIYKNARSHLDYLWDNAADLTKFILSL